MLLGSKLVVLIADLNFFFDLVPNILTVIDIQSPYNLPIPSHKELKIRWNFIGECNPHMSHNWTQSMQHSDIIFLDITNVLLTLLSIFLQAAAQHACQPKVSYWSNSLCFFLPIQPKQHAPTPAFCRFPFCCDPPNPCHVSACFQTRGAWHHHWDVSAHRKGGYPT